MAVSLTATPQPDTASVRLRLDATVDANPVVWDYSTAGIGNNAFYNSQWVETGAGWIKYHSAVSIIVSDSVHNGTTYITRTFTGLTIGQRYSVTVWMSPDSVAQVILGRGTTAVRSFYAISSASPDSGNGSSPYTYEFVAATTSEEMRLTFRSTSSGSIGASLTALSIRPIPSQRLAYFQNVAASDSGNWSQITAVPADATATTTAPSFPLPAGGNQYSVLCTYRMTGGEPVQFLPGTVGLKRTITGLTVGRTYRVNMRVAANSVMEDTSSGSVTASRLSMVAGVAGKGVGTPSTADWITHTFVATATSHVVEARIASFSEVYANPAGEVYVQLLESVLYVEDMFANLAEPYTLTSLVRSDANGTRSVRRYEGQELSAGVLVTTDPEAALIGLVKYTAKVLDNLANKTITVDATADFNGSVTRSRIAPASLPSQGGWYDLATGLSIGRATTSAVAQVINRPDPLVTLGSQTLRSGTVSIFCDTFETGMALERVFNLGEVVLLRQPDYMGLDMYLVGTRTSLDLQEEVTDPRRWVLSVDYTEVAAPTTPLRGSIGWTIAESYARNATLAASRAEFPTVLSLLVGPQS